MHPRISESDLRYPVLKLLGSSPNGFVSTSSLISKLTDLFHPQDADAKILNGRHDTYFSQKVRNLVSHKNARTGLEFNNLAIHDKKREGWTITEMGRALIGASSQ